jgi:hypothetical protein
MRTPFSERAEAMGLDTALSYKGLYKYSDRYGEVVYRELSTAMLPDDTGEEHETDNKRRARLSEFLSIRCNRRPKDA